MTIKEHEKGIKRLKKHLSKLKRDRERLNDLIALCEEMLEDSTHDTIDNYILKCDEIIESFEIIEIIF